MRALVVGGGPAGLMAAEQLLDAGVSVTLADAMPTVGRKLLMAGKSGLNLTKAEPTGPFLAAYSEGRERLGPILAAFGPQQVTGWAEGLGQETFVGSTGRVFPSTMKASPLLRAWLARLAAKGLDIRLRWRCTGFMGDRIGFDTPVGPQVVAADVTVLALGGGSWRRLGSDGAWAGWLGAKTVPFAASNVGVTCDWSPHMATHFGAPIKGSALQAGAVMSRGEFVISRAGLEGGGIYSLSPALRDGAGLRLDLFPDRSEAELRARLTKGPAKASTTTRLRKALRLSGARLALLNEFGRPFPDDLAPLLKALPIAYTGLRPLDDAISTAGGVSFDALDSDLMVLDRPGVYCAGEMVAWDAPTGGYLLTACLATGRWAGQAAARRLAGQL